MRLQIWGQADFLNERQPVRARDCYSNTDGKVATPLSSPDGSHLAVGVGPARCEVSVGGLCDHVHRADADLRFASVLVVAFEKSDRYIEAAAVTVVAVLVLGLS